MSNKPAKDRVPSPFAYFDIVHSPDDGGYYAEVYDQKGVQLYETDLQSNKKAVVAEVYRWTGEQGLRAILVNESAE